jgi:hypothetical protein
MADRKTMTRQALIGEKGIELISRRCLQMGYLFHPRRIDHGIDGHIDLVEAGTGAVLNLTLLVQSKAKDRPFQGESADGFCYPCDQRDLDMWLSGNAPVILVFSHPEQEEAWWVEVKAAFPDATARAKRMIFIDKRTQRFDRDAAAALMELAMPKDAGLYLRPPSITETLTTNLLSVAEMPSALFVATSRFGGDYRAAGEALAERGMRASGWVLRDGMVHSFGNLREEPGSVLCEGDVEEHAAAEWAESDDLDTLYRFQDLLTRTAQDSYPELRWHKERRHVHFRATTDLSPKKVSRRLGGRGRTVFGPHPDKREPGKIGYYHHAALQMRFRRIDGAWFCELEPDYCFTSDGVTEHRNADKLTAGIKRLERHAAVSGWTSMWAAYLRGPGDLLTPPKPVEFADLLTVQVERGIDDKRWGPTPAADGDELQERALREEDAVTAELASVGVDTEDLMLFLDGSDEELPTEPGADDPANTRRSGSGRKARHAR